MWTKDVFGTGDGDGMGWVGGVMGYIAMGWVGYYAPKGVFWFFLSFLFPRFFSSAFSRSLAWSVYR